MASPADTVQIDSRPAGALGRCLGVASLACKAVMVGAVVAGGVGGYLVSCFADAANMRDIGACVLGGSVAALLVLDAFSDWRSHRCKGPAFSKSP